MTPSDLAKCRRSRWAMRWADRLLAAAAPVEPEDRPCRVSGENPGGDTPKGGTRETDAPSGWWHY